MWKQKSGKIAVDGSEATVFNKLHKDKEVNTPRMGGSVIWISAYVVGSIIWLLSQTMPFDFLVKLEFISRDQTWIPFAALLIGALVGLIDDMLEIKGGGGRLAGGLSLKKRLLVVGAIGVAVSSWFFLKLDVTTISLPFDNYINLGWLIIPIFSLIMIAIYAGGVIDGIDGLAGGVFASMFTAYGVIAYSLNQINLAAFCGLIVGGILAFLWFNIPPARFYMSETGSMALTITLVIIAFMTDSIGGGIGIFVLPIIAFPLVITVLSIVIQLTYKKLNNGKKIFHSTPIHHHFEALGWPNYKVTMRYWVVSIICSIAGVIITLVS
jgi:phospho-N-acetylmuramoyl-pentapeptide-transferase